MNETLTIDEQEMLLNRPIGQLLTARDRDAFAGRVCMITGAGGTVGGELARQIGRCRPSLLVLVDHSEHALFRIELDIRESAPETPAMAVLCDVTRAHVVRRMIRRLRPDVIFHAAAYKHVTMAERAICAAVHVNVLGTCAVLNAAQETDAQLVLISSDKAACPRSVMGATKRFAELAVLAARRSPQRPVVVRFGNVLASSGSFVEVMRERIRAGRSVQVTDPNATRFFMSLGEAASLVMKASTLARGGETFWLDMGEPIRIGDLTERLLRAAERQGWPAVPVEIVGLRPGEKISEQLTSQGIVMKRTEHPGIWVARQPKPAAATAVQLVPAVRRAVHSDDALAALGLLTLAVPDFVPSAQAWAVARCEPTITAARQPAATTAPVVHGTPLTRRARTATSKVVAIRHHAGVTPSTGVARRLERGPLAADGPATAGGRL